MTTLGLNAATDGYRKNCGVRILPAPASADIQGRHRRELNLLATID